MTKQNDPPASGTSKVIKGQIKMPTRPKQQPETKILLATPSYGDSFCGNYVSSVIQLSTWAALNNVGLATSFLNYADIAATRNILLSKFLFEHPTATHLLFVDDDMGFPVKLVADALALKADLVGALYPKRRIDLKKLHAAGQEPFDKALAQANDFVGRVARVSQTRGRFMTADYIGTGFMLLSRSGLNTFLDRMPELRSEKRYAGVLPDWPYPHFLTAFDRLSVDDQEFSEDFAFCYRWRNAGLPIWAARDGELTHTGTQVFDARHVNR
ncbi:hypothetical protein [Thalassovita sp.]|uniref:hypothetical protein n=1 Tax=Thalassovita sp. TaxID=1979401 RepID=UPI0029DE6D2E|nr:hypothetical protein [Thalassovita sp.]